MFEMINYIHLIVATVVGLTALILWAVKRVYPRFFFSMVFLAFAVNVAFITTVYAPYYVVQPIGIVGIPTNYTTVINGTTYVYTNVTLTKTVFTEAGEIQSLPYIGMMVALISAILGFIFLLIASIEGYIFRAYRRRRY